MFIEQIHLGLMLEGQWEEGSVGRRVCGKKGMLEEGSVGRRVIRKKGQLEEGSVGRRVSGKKGQWEEGSVGRKVSGKKGQLEERSVGRRVSGKKGQWEEGSVVRTDVDRYRDGGKGYWGKIIIFFQVHCGETVYEMGKVHNYRGLNMQLLVGSLCPCQ